jgi:hypothetical protein
MLVVVQETREAKRRQRVSTFVMVATAARAVLARRTLAWVIVLAIGVVAAKRMAGERGMPGLDWYLAREHDERRSSA